MSVRVNAESFETEVLKSDVTVLVDFYSDSCVPCKRLSPVLADVEEQYADTLKIAKVNINFDTELVEKYEIQAVPTLIFFKDGKETTRLRGTVKKSDITDILEK
ncbi:MAG: thioredoxin [Acutalibacteraceae bacterium]|nr:thioredoxin [Acutalibacteraceae bacterium]